MGKTKRFIGIVLVVSMLFCALLTPAVEAFGAEKHDSILDEVLFGFSSMSFVDQKTEDRLQALKYASYICLDYTDTANSKSAGTAALGFLSAMKVPKLPKSIADIPGPGGSSHRKYTHMGWCYDYGGNDMADWATRKTILLATTNKVFRFGFLSGRFGQYDEKCESFAALIYYIHVLGDHMEANSRDTVNQMIPLASQPSEKYCLIEELIAQFEILFSDQKDTHIYKALISDLKTARTNGKKFLDSQSHVSINADMVEYRAYAEGVKETLCTYLPDLLEKEKFFSDVFCK